MQKKSFDSQICFHFWFLCEILVTFTSSPQLFKWSYLRGSEGKCLFGGASANKSLILFLGHKIKTGLIFNNVFMFLMCLKSN